LKKYVIATAVAAAVFAPQAFAQDTNGNKFYVGAEYGSFQFKDQSSVATALVGAVGGTASSTQDTGMGVGRFFGGIAITENFGAELGYIYSGSANATFSGVSRTGVAYSGSATQKAYGLDYSAIIRPSISTGLNGMFVRVGGHSLSVESSVSIATGGASGVGSATTSGTGSLIGIGYDGAFNNKLGYRLAYTSYNGVAGASGNDVSLFSLGIIAKF
jgi:hypothetical protein